MILGGKGVIKFLEQSLRKDLWFCPFQEDFNDGEMALDGFHGAVKILMQSCYPEPDKRILELLLMSRLTSSPIKAVVPYMAYSRQANFSQILNIIATTTIKELITVDLHDNCSILPSWIVNLEISPLLLDISDKYELLIAPDRGAGIKVKKLAILTGKDQLLLEKIRLKNGSVKIFCPDIINLKGKNCLIIDDILATGETISQATFQLLKLGAKSVSVFVTHALFNRNNLIKIAQLPLENFYTTDSIHHVKLPSFIQIITLMKLLKQYL